jgi:hypothetical protein
METEHTETVIEKVTSYVKDILGIHEDRRPDVEAKPEFTDVAPHLHFEDTAPVLHVEDTDPEPIYRPLVPISEDAMRLEPRAFTTTKSAADRMKDEQKLPADSDLQKAVERAKATDGNKESAPQAEQPSYRR